MLRICLFNTCIEIFSKAFWQNVLVAINLLSGIIIFGINNKTNIPMESKIALITGGSRGLGRNAAFQLAGKGHDIIITYQSKQEEAEMVIKEIESLGRRAAAIRSDVGDIQAIDSFITQVSAVLKEKWGRDRFDFLINNAGFGASIAFADATEADFDRFSDVHFKGVFFLTQKAVLIMNDGGSIVNLSSGSTRFNVPGYAVYASMKGAVEVLTRYLAKELGPRGISVNIVAPGAVETDFNNAAIRSNPVFKERLAANTALGRVGEANDIGGVVAFLCSPEGHWINGQRIEASGGINL
jgi:NAD(P)-dependent dehydrogenase (short-subunit alcohol dehydrogenase family)